MHAKKEGWQSCIIKHRDRDRCSPLTALARMLPLLCTLGMGRQADSHREGGMCGLWLKLPCTMADGRLISELLLLSGMHMETN